MAAIHDVLFRLLGDEDDARRSLEEIASELEAFSRIHAEAEAELDTTEAKVRLQELERALADLDATTVEPKIQTDIAGVMAQIQVLQAELARLDAQDVEIDVDVQRGVAERLASLVSQTNLLSRAQSKAAGEAKSFGQRILDSAVNMGPLTTQLRVAIPLVTAALSAIVSLVGALAAMVASLAAAVAGVAALGTAFVGSLLPAIGLGIAAVQRFQQQAEKAGTPAHALAQAFKDVGAAAKELLPAADPVLSALARSAHELVGLIGRIKPAFMDFGRAAGEALTPLTRALGSPAIQNGIANLIRLSGDVLKPMVQIGVQLGRIFLNIARAAMPLLAEGMRAVAGALRGIADGTDNITTLRAGIAVLVGHLETWLDLIWQIARVFGNFFKAAMPAGQEFVGWLAEGAEKIADWLGSADGIERIQTFFDNTIPLAKELVEFFGKLILALIQFGEGTAPIVQPLVAALNEVLDVVNWLLNLFAQIPVPIRQAIGVAMTFLLPWTKVGLVIRVIIVLFGALKGVVVTVANAIKGAFVAAFNAVKAAAGAVVSALRAAWNAVKTATVVAWHAITSFLHAAWARIKAIVSGAVNAVVNVIRGAWNSAKAVVTGAMTAIAAAVRSGWNAIKGAVSAAMRAIGSVIRSGWNAIKSAVSAAVRAIESVVKAGWNAIKSAVSAAMNAIKQAVSAGWQAVKSVVSDGVEAAADIVSAAADLFYNAGKALIEALANGIKDVAMAPVNAVKDVVGAVGDLLPGSEPKDKSSPLYGLGDHGKAIVTNLIGGLEDAGPLLAKSLAGQLGQMRTPGAPAATAAAGGTQVEQTFNVRPAAGAPGRIDPHLLAAQLGILMRQQGVASP